MARHQHLLSAEYMVRELDGSKHAALFARPESGLVYDGKQKTFCLEAENLSDGINYDEIYQPCVQACEELLATANKYRKKLKQPILDIKTKHSWADVEQCVKETCDELGKLAVEDKNPSGRTGKIKQAYQRLCRHAGAGMTFSNLIPNDSFNSVLCGGIKVIFTGLRQTGLHREQIYRALEELPHTLSDLAARVKVYHYDEELHRLTASLYVAVLQLLNHILLWFVKNSFITGLRTVVDPLGFSDDLNQRIAQVKMTAQWFETHAITLSLQMQRDGLRLQYGQAYQQDHMDEKLQTLLDRTEDLEERVARAAVLQNLNPLLIDQWMDTLERRFIETHTLRGTRSKQKQRQKQLAAIGPQEVLKHFLYDSEMVFKDCNALKRLANPSGRTEVDLDRIRALQSNYCLQAFLTVDEPSLILLNGRTEARHDSEVSIFSAFVVDYLLAQYEEEKANRSRKFHSVPVAYFCGQHRNWRADPNASAEEAGMNLLLQLIDRHGDLLDTNTLQNVYETTDPEDMTSICAALDSLITSFKINVFVILVVDGLRHFTQPPERCEKTRELVTCLVGIYRKRPPVTLKFLFTNPTRAEFVEDLFEEHELVNIPRNVRGSDRPVRLTIGSTPRLLEPEEL